MQQTDKPLEVNDLMVAIVAKALRWRVAFGSGKWDATLDAEQELLEAVDAYRKYLDGCE